MFAYKALRQHVGTHTGTHSPLDTQDLILCDKFETGPL